VQRRFERRIILVIIAAAVATSENLSAIISRVSNRQVTVQQLGIGVVRR